MPTLVVLVGGDHKALETAYRRNKDKVPVLVVSGTGGAADFIADAFDRQQSVHYYSDCPR